MQGFPGYISPMNSAKIPTPLNEPVLSYAPGTRERTELKQALQDLSSRQIDIPIVIGGKEIRTGRTIDTVMPHDHGHILARVHQAGGEEVSRAVAAARDAQDRWARAAVALS